MNHMAILLDLVHHRLARSLLNESLVVGVVQSL